MVEASIEVRFGQRLRQLRRERGLSQEGFALAAKLDRTYVSGIERGTRNCSLRTLERLAATLDMTMTEMFEGV